MKTSSSYIIRPGILFLMLIIFQYLSISVSNAQYPGINNDIARLRKGVLTVLAKTGDKVEIEQLSHEFWFGCAISNGLASERMPAEDKNMYKARFLENFNSAVTENAVKWLDMERKQGEVNYGTVDGILKWTDENNIPLRGHNIFWGIPKFVQPWLKEMNDADLEKTLKNRAETLAARYKGRFAEYALNNEMVHGNYYEDRLGPEITKKMA
ncbi:MAG: endo-1,4-beta-xylanase, partial [Bacteroidia bacterium]|nr:endo-1,4-beta-xylanase [Bacteroidia bacterium]